MKKCMVMTFLLICTLTAGAQGIEALWKKYREAESLDRTKDKLDVLGTIKTAAARERSSWDYFEACEQYAVTRINMNWKDRDAANSQFKKEIDEYGSAVLKFMYMQRHGCLENDSLLEYATDHKEEFGSSCINKFYNTLTGRYVFADALIPLLDNDLDWALWMLAWNEIPELLKDRTAGKYPEAALVELQGILQTGDSGKRRSGLEGYVGKYQGKAVALLARDELLSIRFNGNDTVTEKDFIALKADAGKLKEECRRAGGSEKTIAACCHNYERVLEGLSESGVMSVDADYDKLTVSVRNLKEFVLRLRLDGKATFETKVTNPRNSFYVPDTLHIKLPDMDDGKYDVECSFGKDMEIFSYERYSLSISLRRDSRGCGCFVCDALTGEPLKTCTLKVGDKVSQVSCSDGFVTVQAKNRESVQASVNDGMKRLSRTVNTYSSAVPGPVRMLNAMILPDRRAFNPGETVHFKVILSKGRELVSRQTLTAVLMDAESNVVAEKELKTNEFGSAASEFELVTGRRNGSWRIDVKNGSEFLNSVFIVVDEFVLPSFDVEWDRQERLFLSGDTVSVTGKIVSYSGHPVEPAGTRCTVDGTQTGVFKLEPSGRFSLEFISDKDLRFYSSHWIKLIVTDSTGETHEFDNSVEVAPSIPLNVSLKGSVQGCHDVASEREECLGIVEDEAEILFSFGRQGLERRSVTVDYVLAKDGKVWEKGSMSGCGSATVDLKAAPDGIYHLEVSAREGERKTEYKGFLLKVNDSPGDVGFICRNSGEDAVSVGVSGKPVWVVAELFDSQNNLLTHKIVKVGPSGKLQKVAFPIDGLQSETLQLCILCFRDHRCHSWSRTINCRQPRASLPLSLNRFLDTTVPGGTYTFSIRTEPGVEVAATIFDLSTETFAPNLWREYFFSDVSHIAVQYWNSCGTASSMFSRFRTKALLSAGRQADNFLTDSVEEESFSAQSVNQVQEPAIRRNFNPSVAWLPFLRSDNNGEISFSFTNTDRLSTYAVQLFAHDRNFRQATLRREMLVTIPVKVSLVEPGALHEGDRWQIRTTLSNASAQDVSGTVRMVLYDGPGHEKELLTYSETVCVKAGGNVTVAVPFKVPQGLDELGILPSFEGEGFSDAVYVTVPVSPASQRLTEAHSALLKDGDSRELLVEVLRNQFVNADGLKAEVRETGIADMLKAAVPEKIVPQSDNVICLADAYLSVLLTRNLGGWEAGNLSELKTRILDCRHAGGGWSWFKGMDPSGIITLTLLDRFAKMSALDPSVAGAFGQEDAVRWLDNYWFSDSDRPYWCGRPTLEQYLNVRSLYPDVPFSPKADAKELREFRSKVRDHLTATRNLSAPILSKAIRLSTLQNLLTLGGGSTLAKSWGVSLSSRLRRSLSTDIESLRQYAVVHDCGGCYYPNAVMPWRGLMDSELYAHTLICRVLTAEGGTESLRIAEGLRLWMMVQKETQDWGSDPAYLDALLCVSQALPSTLSTRVLALFSDCVTPFPEIRPAGNGFTLNRVWMREDGTELQEGDTLTLGEKILAEYRIWSGENRSFVRVTVPRPALLMPSDQLSGPYGWHFRPLRFSGFQAFSPQGWRNVRTDRTEFYFDAFPEEHTNLQEEFFVTRNGSFSAGAPIVESMYAPHYRANGEGTVLSTGDSLRL